MFKMANGKHNHTALLSEVKLDMLRNLKKEDMKINSIVSDLRNERNIRDLILRTVSQTEHLLQHFTNLTGGGGGLGPNGLG